MEKIAFQLAWLGEHKLLVFLFFSELLIAACLLISFFHLRLERRRLKINGSGEKGNFDGFDLVDDPCFLLRASDLFPLYVTRDFEEQFGLTKEQLKTDVLSFTAKLPEKEAKLLQKEYESWDGKTPILMDVEPVGKDICYRLSVTRRDGMDLFHFRDITEEKRQLDEMRADLEAAENVSQSKSAYLSEMSHEIRTPLNGIIGMLTLAHRQLHGHSAEDYIVKAEQLSEFLLTVINEVLDMSRIEVGKIELENKPFDLYHLADQIRNLFKKTIEEKGVSYIVEMKDVDVRYVVGDEERISQILVNLLSNASKFTEKGEIRVTFRQMMRNENSVEFLFRVHDTGKGMDPKFIKRIFHPFEQENAGITKQYGGSGLGMAITDKLIQLMGGSILVESMPGEGSDFSVYLTLPLADHPENVVPVDSEEDVDDFTYEGCHILMAEDNEVNAEIAVSILDLSGASVDVAVNGRDAVEKFAAAPPGTYDFILMDIQMPEMNGRDAARAIRKLDHKDAKTIPIFALSADAFVEDQRLSIASGMNGHFSKPIDFEKIRKEIGRVLKEKK